LNSSSEQIIKIPISNRNNGCAILISLEGDADFKRQRNYSTAVSRQQAILCDHLRIHIYFVGCPDINVTNTAGI